MITLVVVVVSSWKKRIIISWSMVFVNVYVIAAAVNISVSSSIIGLRSKLFVIGS